MRYMNRMPPHSHDVAGSSGRSHVALTSIMWIYFPATRRWTIFLQFPSKRIQLSALEFCIVRSNLWISWGFVVATERRKTIIWWFIVIQSCKNVLFSLMTIPSNGWLIIQVKFINIVSMESTLKKFQFLSTRDCVVVSPIRWDIVAPFWRESLTEFIRSIKFLAKRARDHLHNLHGIRRWGCVLLKCVEIILLAVVVKSTPSSVNYNYTICEAASRVA